MKSSFTCSGYCKLPFLDHKRKDINSGWLADQKDKRSVLGHVQYQKGRIKGYDHEIDTAQTQKRFNGLWLLWRKAARLSLIASRTITRTFVVPKYKQNLLR